MRRLAGRASFLTFAGAYLATGGFFSAGMQTSAATHCMAAVFWPFVFGSYSPLGTFIALAGFGCIASYAGFLQRKQQALRFQLSALVASAAELSEQLSECAAACQCMARERDAALARLPIHGVTPIDATGLGQVKQAFARRYHPDRLQADDPKRKLHTEVFQEFWPEILRIERQAKGRN